MAEEETTRQQAWGGLVRRARDRWLNANPGKTVQDFCDFLNISTPTLYRDINGTWTKDPERDRVDRFGERLRIPKDLMYRTLGWVVDKPARHTPPEPDPDVDALGRTLADPEVSEADKQWIRDIVRFATQRRSPKDTTEG